MPTITTTRWAPYLAAGSPRCGDQVDGDDLPATRNREAEYDTGLPPGAHTSPAAPFTSAGRAATARGHPDYPAKVGDNVAIALGGTDKDRLTKAFNDLAEGGRIQMPLALQPWGAEVGWLRDRFGINWTVSIDAA